MKRPTSTVGLFFLYAFHRTKTRWPIVSSPEIPYLEYVLKASTIQLLRVHFSFFLLPVYLFAIGEVPSLNITDALIIFVILHLLIYPASNGYNSYMDRDEESVGGILKPMQPTRQLFYVSVALDVIALIAGLLISITFSLCLLAYILASRAYSFRGIRLKRYPVIGYLTVIFFQGAVVFFMTYHGSSMDKTYHVPAMAMLASSLLIGGFYPLTQIYQHQADLKDGVKTISYLLGYRGTFIFTALIYVSAMSVLAQYFYGSKQEKKLFIVATLMLPVLVYFFVWAAKVWNNSKEADFRNTMRMNLIASICTNLAFFTLLIWKFFE
ncbi:MAG TPA: UbiA family prenyltransferase [Flavitalea sp.]|nr:UbiA family prenyltransferase [Flavitalea sp.]